MKNRKLTAVFAALGMALLAAGCSGKTPAAESTETLDTEVQEEQEPEEEEPEDLSEEEAQELYNLYVEVNNYMVGRLSESVGKYFEYIDYQEEFSVLKDDYFCYSISESFFKELDEADELAARRQEKTALDEAFLAFSPSVRELASVLNDVYAYTDEDSWQEDDYEKGRELHGKLWAALDSYGQLGADFIAELDAVASDQRESDLEQMKEEGYVVSYALVKMISTAQEIQAAVYEQGIEDDSMMLQLDTEALQPLYDQYLEEVETVLGYLQDEEALAKEGYPTQSAYYVTFEDAVENSAEELKEIFRKVAEQEEPGGYGIVNVFTVDGSLAGFYNKVSAMIDDYNRIINY